MTTEKTIDGYLIVDWKKESHRTRQSKPSPGELGANELLAEISVDVTVPDVEVPTLALEIDVPEAQVHAATLDALDDEDLPDWTDAANGVIDEADIRDMDFERFKEWVNAATTEVLVTVNTRPDPERVREYIHKTAGKIRQGESGDGVEP